MPLSTRFFALTLYAHALALPASAQLSYVDRSAGLLSPRMEGGDTELEFGDVDGDGHVDIVSIGDHGSPFVNTSEHGVMVWFGDGAGNWSVFQNGNFGYGGVALGDVNNDGLMDVGYGMHHDYSSSDFGDQLLEVALGDGTGRGWTPWDDGLATNGETWGMFGTDFADIDNDGLLDVGSVSFGCCAGVHVYRNNGDGTWTQTFGFLGGNSRGAFAFGDVNGDGNADFAVGHQSGVVYLGDGAGNFTRDDGNLPSGGNIGHRGLSLGDVTGDGRDDLAFATPGGGLSVWSWVASGTWQDLSGSLPTSGEFRRTQIADMDLDGIGDLVAYENGRVVVFGGDGLGGWQQLASVTTPAACDDGAFRAGVDADHNGFPDFVYVAEENCQPFVGGINRPRFFAESSTPTQVSVYAKSPRGGETLVAGSVHFIDWHAAVPAGQTPAMTIELSQTGPGGSWSTIAAGAPNNGRFQWLLPASLRSSTKNYLRFTLASATTLAGPFTILGSGLPRGDLNCDGVFNGGDIDPFFLALGDPAAYTAAFPGCDILNGDMNNDGRLDGGDIDPFFECLGGGACP